MKKRRTGTSLFFLVSISKIITPLIHAPVSDRIQYINYNCMMKLPNLLTSRVNRFGFRIFIRIV